MLNQGRKVIAPNAPAAPGSTPTLGGDIPVTIAAADELIKITGAAIAAVSKDADGNIVISTTDGKQQVLEKGFQGCKCDKGKWKTYIKNGDEGPLQKYQTMEECYNDEERCMNPSIWKSEDTNGAGYFKANTLNSSDHVFGY